MSDAWDPDRYGRPGLSFAAADIADLDDDEAWDVVFSNAALQWVAGHEALLARLARALRPGGQLAVQVPANHGHPSHRIAAVVDWVSGTTLARFRRLLPSEAYDAYVADYSARLLDELGDRSPYFYAYERILFRARRP